MFQRLRIDLTLRFLALAGLVYFLLIALSLSIFYRGLTDSLDQQLNYLAGEILPAIEVDGSAITLRKWPKSLAIDPLPVLPNIQLWNNQKQLVAEYGPDAIDALFIEPTEVAFQQKLFRCLSKPVMAEKRQLGYVQVQIKTEQRDQAISQFLMAVLISSPLLMLGLALGGYLYAKKALEPLERSMKILRQFAADAGHELKTPLSIIQGASDNLAEEIKDSHPSFSRVSTIRRAAERMNTMVQDLLLLAELDHSPHCLKKTEFNLDNLVRDLFDEIQENFEDKGIKLELQCRAPANIFADREKLVRAIGNLLQNALKYTETGRKVQLSTGKDSQRIIISVRNEGPGIPKQFQDKIFERFFRTDEARSRGEGGSGLGLAIVKSIAEAHGGEVSLSSQVGEGADFSIKLPVSKNQ